jgi:hypothetical protein
VPSATTSLARKDNRRQDNTRQDNHTVVHTTRQGRRGPTKKDKTDKPTQDDWEVDLILHTEENAPLLQQHPTSGGTGDAACRVQNKNGEVFSCCVFAFGESKKRQKKVG